MSLSWEERLSLVRSILITVRRKRMNVLRKMYQEKAGWVTDAMFPGIVIAFHMIILWHGFVIVLSMYTVHHSMKGVILYDVFFPAFRVCTDTLFPEAYMLQSTRDFEKYGKYLRCLDHVWHVYHIYHVWHIYVDVDVEMGGLLGQMPNSQPCLLPLCPPTHCPFVKLIPRLNWYL